MISDSQSDQANSNNTTADVRWKKAFRTTVQKSLLGTVIFATGTRAIYFTVQVTIMVVILPRPAVGWDCPAS